MKVRLNLATVPLTSNRRFSVGATILGTLGLLALFLLSVRVYAVWSSDRALRARAQSYQREIGVLQAQRQNLASFFDQPDSIRRRQRAAYLNGLIQQRAFPWIKIFMDLERILPEGVRVVSVEPKLAGDNVQLRFVVGAMTDEGKVQFLQRLEKSPEFSNIELLTESHPAQAASTDLVVLQMQAIYSAI